MFRLRTPLPSFAGTRASHASHRPARITRCRPSRLTLTAAAAATATAVTAVALAVSSGGPATSPASPASDASAVIRVANGAAGQTGQTAQGAVSAPQAAASGRQEPAAHPATAARPAQPARAGQPTRPAQAAPQPKPSPSAQPAAPTQPYLIYDSVTPGAIPPGYMIAAYSTGRFAASASEVAGRGPVLWIDTTGTDYAASALDVEPGNVTPSQAAIWAWHRLSANPDAIAHIYTFKAEWPTVQAAVAALPGWMQARVRWWIADPTGVPHIVPGSQATQWYWGPNYDISTATTSF